MFNKNADLPTDASARSAFLAELVKAEPKELKALAAKVGWVDGDHVFVRHTGVSGEPEGKRQLRPPMWVKDARYRSKITGELETYLCPLVRREAEKAR